jgi:hypothetical protein
MHPDFKWQIRHLFIFKNQIYSNHIQLTLTIVLKEIIKLMVFLIKLKFSGLLMTRISMVFLVLVLVIK